MSATGKLTPLMQQYWDIKNAHPDEVVLFRMGDFYEMFHQDAEIAAPILNIALTQRNRKSNDSTKMCGVPHHSIAGPIAKLLAAGLKVAICDQIEDPATAKGIVKRAVTRVLTPGMVYDPDTLDELSANYMASYDESRLAFVDITTFEAFYFEIDHESEREELLHLLRPVELVLNDGQARQRDERGYSFKTLISRVDHKLSGDARDRLKSYVAQMQGDESVKSWKEFELRRRQARLAMQATTYRHLEVFENSRGERKGTLFEAIQRTRTSAGSRLLKTWLLSPLTDADELVRRQNEIKLWLESSTQLKRFREKLVDLGDIERRLGKIHTVTFNGRDLKAIAQSVLAGVELTSLHPSPGRLDHLNECSQLSEKIERMLVEEPPIGIKDGGLIRQGVDSELDELISLTTDSQKLLSELEARERTRTGIASLKIRYNNVFGFYIELTKTHAAKAPSDYMRKQTLANAERFTTNELSALEEKVLSAKAKRDRLEHELFIQLRQEVIDQTPALLHLARIWTRWDVTSGLAWLALERNYACPTFNNQGQLHIELGRHPVIEQLTEQRFVPNSIRLQGGDCLLLTGPNMAGKSTLMRQVALIGLLAQIGSFVPARSANLPLFDRIATRIGASDALSEGLSTFMVEMSETAEILRRAGSRTLVILDEIGRGTSTYDGLSLAQAILEHLVQDKKPYLLFATHYHELTGLSSLYPQIHNAHMSIQEKGGEVRFLHTLVQGPANRSYGIHVAELAGLPKQVSDRAGRLLKSFESQSQSGTQLSLELAPPLNEPMEPPTPEIIEKLREMNLSGMTPIDALNTLYAWQREVSS